MKPFVDCSGTLYLEVPVLQARSHIARIDGRPVHSTTLPVLRHVVSERQLVIVGGGYCSLPRVLKLLFNQFFNKNFGSQFHLRIRYGRFQVMGSCILFFTFSFGQVARCNTQLF